MGIIFEGVETPTACCFVDGEHSTFAHFEYCKFYNICEKRDTIKTNYKPSDCPVKALEQEPTTKNDKVDCEHTDCNNCVNHKYCDYELTTKHDLGVDYTINGLDDFIEFGKKAFGVELTIKKSDNPDTYEKLFEATKNDLGVDCISRAEVLKLIEADR